MDAFLKKFSLFGRYVEKIAKDNGIPAIIAAPIVCFLVDLSLNSKYSTKITKPEIIENAGLLLHTLSNEIANKPAREISCLRINIVNTTKAAMLRSVG